MRHAIQWTGDAFDSAPKNQQKLIVRKRTREECGKQLHNARLCGKYSQTDHAVSVFDWPVILIFGFRGVSAGKENEQGGQPRQRAIWSRIIVRK
jgi:hypothetical protein